MAMPPKSPPPKGPPADMPAEGAPPDPQAFMAQAKESLGGSLPDGRFSVKVVQKLVDCINKAIPKILGDNAPDGEVPMPAVEGSHIEGKLPVDVVLPAAILLGVAAEVEPKYALDPALLADDDAIRDVCDLLAMASKDKAVIDHAKGDHKEPDADDSGGPPDGDADDMGAKPKPPMPDGVRSAM